MVHGHPHILAHIDVVSIAMSLLIRLQKHDTYLGSTFELHPADVVDIQGFANQLEGVRILAEHQALLFWNYLAQPHDSPYQPLNLTHPVAHNSNLHIAKA